VGEEVFVGGLEAGEGTQESGNPNHDGSGHSSKTRVLSQPVNPADCSSGRGNTNIALRKLVKPVQRSTIRLSRPISKVDHTPKKLHIYTANVLSPFLSAYCTSNLVAPLPICQRWFMSQCQYASGIDMEGSGTSFAADSRTWSGVSPSTFMLPLRV
jgi:hypothetical protein